MERRKKHKVCDRLAMLWIDVEDLLCHSRSGNRPSGIQRFTYETCRAFLAAGGPDIGFVRHGRFDELFSGGRVVRRQGAL